MIAASARQLGCGGHGLRMYARFKPLIMRRHLQPAGHALCRVSRTGSWQPSSPVPQCTCGRCCCAAPTRSAGTPRLPWFTVCLRGECGAIRPVKIAPMAPQHRQACLSETTHARLPQARFLVRAHCLVHLRDVLAAETPAMASAVDVVIARATRHLKSDLEAPMKDSALRTRSASFMRPGSTATPA